MSISLQGIYKNFGSIEVLHGIDLEAKKGRILALLGPNGAGKTTTMRIITGMLSPTRGEVYLEGIPLKEKPRRAKAKIGYLAEHNPLYLDMYVREYLQYVARIFSLSGKNIKQRLTKTIEQTGLSEVYKKKIGTLSKGYRQRVGIAQALIHDPPIIILDEPTSGLDPNQLVEIRRLIQAMRQKKTIVFSTHILQEVTEVADDIALIHKGKVIALQKADDFMQTTTNRTLSITFDKVYPVDANFFQAIEGIHSVQKMDDASWKMNFDLVKKDIRPLIFQKAAAHNFNLIAMETQKPNLERIFQNLTQSHQK